MFRLYGALAVLGALVLISAAGFFINKTTADRIAESLEESLSLAKEGRTAESEEAVDQAQSLLHSRLETMFMFSSHKKLDDIEQCIDKAKIFLDNDELPSYYVYCSSALEMIRDYRSNEYPTIYNIL